MDPAVNPQGVGKADGGPSLRRLALKPQPVQLCDAGGKERLVELEFERQLRRAQRRLEQEPARPHVACPVDRQGQAELLFQRIKDGLSLQSLAQVPKLACE